MTQQDKISTVALVVIMYQRIRAMLDNATKEMDEDELIAAVSVTVSGTELFGMLSILEDVLGVIEHDKVCNMEDVTDHIIALTKMPIVKATMDDVMDESAIDTLLSGTEGNEVIQAFEAMFRSMNDSMQAALPPEVIAPVDSFTVEGNYKLH